MTTTTKKGVCEQLALIIEGKLLDGQRVWLDKEQTLEVIGLEWWNKEDDQGNAAAAVLVVH